MVIRFSYISLEKNEKKIKQSGIIQMKKNILIVLGITGLVILFKFWRWPKFSVIDIIILITLLSAQVIYVNYFLGKMAKPLKILIVPLFITLILIVYFYVFSKMYLEDFIVLEIGSYGSFIHGIKKMKRKSNYQE